MNGQPDPIQRRPAPPPALKRQPLPPRVQSLGTPLDFRRGQVADQPPPPLDDEEPAPPNPQGTRKQATETIAQRAGALIDEVDFVDFVAGLVHGTFDAIVDSSIRQMEAYADLVSAVAKTVEQFTEENVSLNQARDWIVQQYPEDVALDLSGAPTVFPKPVADDPEGLRSPSWLREFQLEGEELTAELLEETIVPRARLKIGQSRQQTLATLVLLGLNRVVVRDGTISAKLRFRAAAADKAKVEYAVSSDPGGSKWGTRGTDYQATSTKVSTVGVNVQSDAELRAELTGEVKINFASETLPLERFADDARRTMLERRAKPSQAHAVRSAPAPEPPALVVTSAPAAPLPPAPAPAPAPAPVQPPANRAT